MKELKSQQLKYAAKRELLQDWRLALKLFWPALGLSALYVIGVWVYQLHEVLIGQTNLGGNIQFRLTCNVSAFVISIVLTFCTLCYYEYRQRSSDVVSADGVMGQLIHNRQLAGGIISIKLLSIVQVVLWSFLLIVPGVIKLLDYAMASLIYYDAIQAGQPMWHNSALVRSQRLMTGHRWQLFKLMLSFVPLLICCAIPVVGLFVLSYLLPYIRMTLVKFYQTIRDEEPTSTSQTLVE